MRSNYFFISTLGWPFYYNRIRWNHSGADYWIDWFRSQFQTLLHRLPFFCSLQIVADGIQDPHRSTVGLDHAGHLTMVKIRQRISYRSDYKIPGYLFVFQISKSSANFVSGSRRILSRRTTPGLAWSCDSLVPRYSMRSFRPRHSTPFLITLCRFALSFLLLRRHRLVPYIPWRTPFRQESLSKTERSLVPRNIMEAMKRLNEGKTKWARTFWKIIASCIFLSSPPM